MQIVLVRHGETEWSLSGQHTSRTDLPLIEVGRERARALEPLLVGWEFSRVLTSPLRRARETCELAGFGDRAEVSEDLREWDYGEYEGLTTPQIREQRPDWSLWRDGCPGGEQPSEISARADLVLDRMRGAGGDVLAFAHGHIFRVLAARWIELPASGGARLALKAGAICALGYERETEVISLWNDAPR
ncbi:MAG: histidine phosphatase family protein [Solirubrobacterales bacterium]|nr:histidine phosphatase family protein [Solirubrobacterales bacterium]